MMNSSTNMTIGGDNSKDLTTEKGRRAYLMADMEKAKEKPREDNSHLDVLHQQTIGNDTYLDLRLELHDVVPEPIPAYSIGGALVGSLGNISVISGKAKSRKTFLTSAIVSGVLSSEFGVITSGLAGRVLWCDTEQSKNHAHRVLKRVAHHSGMSPYDLHRKFFFLPLREKATADRLKLIEQAIYDQYRVGLDVVVIDGVKDLVVDFNNIKECTVVIDKLMKWTANFQIHIIACIHENKGANDQMRGHLGSFLLEKAESVLGVERVIDGDYSKIAPKVCRNMEFKSFALYVDGDGNMSTGELERKGKSQDFDSQALQNLVDMAFHQHEVYTSKEQFQAAISKLHSDIMRKPLPEKKGRLMILTMENEGMIEIKHINSRKVEIKRISEFPF